jgi:hypothetical protein
MALRRVGAIVLATGSVVGTVVLRRRQRRHQTRVDLYFSDGSMVSLPDTDANVAAIVPAANAIIHAA